MAGAGTGPLSGHTRNSGERPGDETYSSKIKRKGAFPSNDYDYYVLPCGPQPSQQQSGS